MSGELDASLRQAINRAQFGRCRTSSIRCCKSSALTQWIHNAMLSEQHNGGSVLSGGEKTTGAVSCRAKIALSSDLGMNQHRMRNAEQEAERLADGLDDVARLTTPRAVYGHERRNR